MLARSRVRSGRRPSQVLPRFGAVRPKPAGWLTGQA